MLAIFKFLFLPHILFLLLTHLGPAEKGIKARGDLFLMCSGSKRKGS